MTAKRILDVIGATTALVVLSPFLIVVALCIRLTTAQPAIFAQTRIGHNGQPIKVYKFRTMRYSSDQLTQVNDERITPVGRVIRATSIDELPQLFNVLRGDMSIVGPRPYVPSMDLQYEHLPLWNRRYDVKPGITGLAQAKGLRGTIQTDRQMRERLAADVLYVKRQGVLEDTRIILQTIWICIKGTNAY